MSEAKPSLGDLPVEILELFAPNPFRVDTVEAQVRIDWITRSFPNERRANVDLTAITPDAEALNTLRALSATNQQLRAVALPKLWAMVRLISVAEFAAFRQILRSSSDIAKHVRSFSFVWGFLDYDFCDSWWAIKRYTVLDLAFVDRFQLWNEFRLQRGYAVLRDGQTRWYFVDNEIRYYAPGTYAEDASDWSVASSLRTGTSGPDGMGLIQDIQSADEFTQCIDEVICQLSSLIAFGWNAIVPALPQGAFDALHKQCNLSFLSYGCLTAFKESLHALPLWKLASNLEDLAMVILLQDDEHQECQEKEEYFASFELPQQLVMRTIQDNAVIGPLHLSITCRTIIAAARGGKLRRIRAGYLHGDIVRLFGIPALLPYWVAIEHWHVYDSVYETWLHAASRLRPFLAHASLWLGVSVYLKGARAQRELLVEEVQSLDIHHDENMPQTVTTDDEPISYLRGYLAWLREDAELAEQVADAWNAVVERGEADVVKCGCSRCQPEP